MPELGRKRPQQFMTPSDQTPRSPMSSQERAVMYQNILQNRLKPDERNQINDRQENIDVASGVGSGIEQILKGMFAGGAGAKDTAHWDRSRQIFKQRQDDREKRKDSRLSNLEKLQKSESGREADDPTAPASRTLQNILKRKYPEQAKEINSMSPNQIKDFGKYVFQGSGRGSSETDADKLLKGAKTRYYDRKPGETDADWMMKNLKMKILSDQARVSGDKAPGGRSYETLQGINENRREKGLKELEAGPKTKTRGISQLKQEGIADIGELAETQYDAAVKAGAKSGDYDPTSYLDYLDSRDETPNFMRSKEGRAARNAMNSWVETYLRDASGAAIPPDERSQYYPIYFPMPGEGPVDIANKKALREKKKQNARIASGQQIKQTEKGADGEIRATKERLDEYQSKDTDGKARLDKSLEKVDGGKTVVKRQYSPSRNQTRIQYSDGTTEVIDGK
jgi:hypothetical protein